MSTGANWSVSGTNAAIQVLGTLNVSSGSYINIAGTSATIQVEGTLNVASGKTMLISGTSSKFYIKSTGKVYAIGVITIGNNVGETTFQIDNGGCYYHQNTSAYASTILKGAEDFKTGSKFEINKSAPLGPSGVIFGDLYINLTAVPTDHINCAGGIRTIGNLYIQNTQGFEFRFTNDDMGDLDVSVGNLTISGGTLNFEQGSAQNKKYNLLIGGNYTQTGGVFKHVNALSPLTAKFNGQGKTFSNTGTLTSDNINWEINPGTGYIFYFNSSFSVPTYRTLTLSSGELNIAASKTLTISGDATLICGTNLIKGDGNLSLETSSTIKTANSSGLSASSATGSIQLTGTRSYGTATNFEYNGTSAQIIGDAFSTCRNLTINNSNGITLSTTTTVNNTLVMTAGTLSLGGNSLVYGESATLKYNGSSAQTSTDVEFPNANGPLNLTIDNTAGLTLHSNRAVNGITNVNGILDVGDKVISGDGEFYLNDASTFKTSNTSGITGSIQVASTKWYSSSASYCFYGTSAQVTGYSELYYCNNMTIDNSAGVTLTALTSTPVLEISGVLDLKNGAFNLNDNNLTLVGTVTRTGTAAGTIKSNNNSTLTINGSGPLGTLYFTPSYQSINNLNLNRTNHVTNGEGLVTLGSNLTIDGYNDVINLGSLILSEGVLDLNSNSLTFINGNVPIALTNAGKITCDNSSLVFGTSTYPGGDAFDIPAGIFTNGANMSNLTINRTNYIKILESYTINEALNLTSGILMINEQILFLNGTVTGTGTITGDELASIAIGGTGDLGTLYFTDGITVLGGLGIDKSSGSVTLGSNLILNGSSDPTSYGKISLYNGTLNVGANILTFINGDIPIEKPSGTGTITTTSSSKLTFGEAGFKDGAAFTIPAGTFAGTPTVHTFNINRTNALTLSQDLNVNNTLNLASGVLIANLVTLGSSPESIGTLFVDTAASRIVGMFKRYISTTEAYYKFPVGSLTNYNGIILYYPANPTSGGSLTAKFILGDPGNKTVQVLTDFTTTPNYHVDRYSNHGYWNITNNGNSVAGSYAIFLNASGFPGISTVDSSRAQLRIIKRADSNSDWALIGSHSCASGTTSCMSVKRTCLTSFSDFAIGSSAINNSFDGPLPVKLSSFSSNVNSRNVILTWKTDSEINNAGFDIERKTSNGTWSKVGFVTGKGTINNATIYNFNDNKLNTGKYNYRLKQIDNNGNFEYHNLSGTVEVGVPKNYDLSQNYPNPFNPTTKIDFSLPFDSKVNLIIYDLTGREVKTLVNESRQAGYHTVDMNASMLSSGTYFFRIIANANGKDFISTKKMVLVK